MLALFGDSKYVVDMNEVDCILLVRVNFIEDSDWDANKAVARYTGFASGAPLTATQIPFTIQENVVTQAACQDETAEHVQISTKPSDAGNHNYLFYFMLMWGKFNELAAVLTKRGVSSKLKGRNL